LLIYSVFWFLVGVAVCMVIIAYRFYVTRLHAIEARNEALQQQVEELHAKLDSSILKEERTSREAEQAKQFKQQLLTTMSHEIRTPMNGVMGMAALLAETSLDKEQHDYMETIRQSGETLLTTVNQILVDGMLNFSKASNKEENLENKDFDLRNSLEEVVDLFADKAGKAGLDLLYDIDRNVPEQIIGDSKRVRQILVNLVENAVRFTTRGEVVISVRVLRAPEDNKVELCFEVRDTGAGIPADKIGRIFNGIPGQAAPKGEEQEIAGLGLVICKKLVEMMEGWIEVQSDAGKGCTFTFCIRVSISRKARRNLSQYNLAALEGKQVLLVDDNATGLSILMKQMEQWKIMPLPARSGKQALEILSKHPGLDLVIADMDLQETDGIQLTRSIRARYADLPVILLTRPGDERFKQEPDIAFSILTRPARQYMLRDLLLSSFSGTKRTSPDQQNTMSKLSAGFSEEYPLRILVAEDNAVNQKIAMAILGKLGYTPALAPNGKEVLDMISHEQYDLIIMDIQMPEMDGLEATRMIRLCLDVQPVIIAMTANAMQGDRDDCLQAGMDDYISKPIELDELISQLEKWSRIIKNKREVPDPKE
jgi:signal transduction histidine kinase/DNA-binding response OmpR family regulator